MELDANKEANGGCPRMVVDGDNAQSGDPKMDLMTHQPLLDDSQGLYTKTHTCSCGPTSSEEQLIRKHIFA